MSMKATDAHVRQQRLEEFARAHELPGPDAIPDALRVDAEQFVATGVKTWATNTLTSDGSSASEASRLPAATQSHPHAPGSLHLATDPAKLDPKQMQKLLTENTTCPFVKSAVSSGALPVRNTAEDPLASVADVKAIGNTGGGDLGVVLEFFARGNHTKSLGEDGRLSVEAPKDHWSLHLAGSQGAHPGHSGIMMGEPGKVGSGRLDPTEFARLEAKADVHGFLDYDKIGEHIAENVKRDPNATALDIVDAAKDTLRIAKEGLDVLVSGGDPQQKREFLRALTERLGSNNLLGGAGEFALMFAFVRNQPGKAKGHEKDVRVSDLKDMMFDGKFPENWEVWEKNAIDWLKATIAISTQAIGAYIIGT